jgi:hypothetical protein
MDVLFSKHAKEQMMRRGIDEETVLWVLYQPDQTIVDNEKSTIVIYQSLIKEGSQLFLLRVFVDRDKQPEVIVTLYKTTKIAKYYESEI